MTEEYVLFMLHAGEGSLSQFFIGPLPKSGDVVELVAYEVTSEHAKIALRVVGQNHCRKED